MLGRGGFGKVYKGRLKEMLSSRGIKKVDAISGYSEIDFCCHAIGFQQPAKDEAVVEGSVRPLPWDIRFQIALGMARGLAYLHTADVLIIHIDFKSSNVLLDKFSFVQNEE